jgi:hypothetical protein
MPRLHDQLRYMHPQLNTIVTISPRTTWTSSTREDLELSNSATRQMTQVSRKLTTRVPAFAFEAQLSADHTTSAYLRIRPRQASKLTRLSYFNTIVRHHAARILHIPLNSGRSGVLAPLSPPTDEQPAERSANDPFVQSPPDLGDNRIFSSLSIPTTKLHINNDDCSTTNALS